MTRSPARPLNRPEPRKRGAARRPPAVTAASRAADTSSAAGGDVVFSIGQLAAEFEITTRTIRFYETRGLISPERAGLKRIYSRRDRARLQLILRGKNLGFSIEDIGEYLSLYDADPTQRVQTEALLQKLDTRIASLEAQRADLERSLAELIEIRADCLGHLKSARS